MRLVAKKIVLFSLLATLHGVLNAKELSILVIGQSISSNCNDYIFGEKDGVYQYDKNGDIIKAHDPFVWGDCKGGSMWIPLGERLIKEKIASRVIFMPIGVDGAKVSDWLEEGSAHEKLKSALIAIKNKKIVFDYIFWYQGSSDIGVNQNKYKKNLYAIREKINEVIPMYTPWIIARHSSCYGRYDKNIEATQSLIARGLPVFYEGPNNNTLGESYRTDNCHLNKIGQEKMAEMWVTSIKKAILKKEEFERESAVRFFRGLSF